MKTMLGVDIPESTRGIVYLCHFNGETIEVIKEVLCESSFLALTLYAEIPNPESQVVLAKTYEELIYNLEVLHKNMKDEEWLKELANCI